MECLYAVPLTSLIYFLMFTIYIKPFVSSCLCYSAHVVNHHSQGQLVTKFLLVTQRRWVNAILHVLKNVAVAARYSDSQSQTKPNTTKQICTYKQNIA